MVVVSVGDKPVWFKSGGINDRGDRYGRQVSNVTAFKYLGRIIMATYNNWPSAASNLSKAINNWVQAYRILGQMGDNSRTSGELFKMYVQVVLLFVS